MKNIRWLHLIVPAIAAALAAGVGSVDFWDGSKASILTALSVIAAGVLVRLARGLSFTSADQYTVEEVRNIAAATKQSVRTLRALIAVVFATMIILVVAKPAVANLENCQFGWISQNSSSLFSALISFLLAYVFVRIFAVIEGDIGLVELQSQFLVRSVERKQAERFQNSRTASGGGMIQTPETFGKIVQ